MAIGPLSGTTTDAPRPTLRERLIAWDPTELCVVALAAMILWQLPIYLLSIPIGLMAISLERLIPYRRDQRIIRQGFRTDVYHAVVTRAATGLLVAIVSLGLLRLHGGLTPWLGWFRAQPGVLQGIEVLLLADLGAYAEHRLSHRVLFLWRFHAVHHSSEEMDWASGFRQHPVDVALLSIAFLWPFLLLGGQSGPAAVALTIYGIYDWANTPWAHANLGLSLGPFWWVIRNPELHRWHHAKERKPGNSNFALVFPIWDVLFHTAYITRERRATKLGIPGGMSNAYLDQIVGPFKPKKRQRRAEG